jgi:transposase
MASAGMVIGGMSYRQTAERFNVSHSIIVRLKQRVNQTGIVNGISAVALATRLVNKTHSFINIVSIEG